MFLLPAFLLFFCFGLSLSFAGRLKVQLIQYDVSYKKSIVYQSIHKLYNRGLAKKNVQQTKKKNVHKYLLSASD